MPVYDFRCNECNTEFSELRPMARSGEPSTCPDCEAIAPRLISAPRLAVMTATQRTAHQVNERSAHEPRMHKQHVCSSGCAHGSSAGDTAKPALKQGKANQRPWMIGH